MKDYYVILGVLPDAEDIVIKAAYKALAQRYHPDKFQNPRESADAEIKMRQINEAYQVLSDAVKRRDYDASRRNGQSQQSRQQNTQQTKQQEDWAIALRFYPDLTDLEARLGKIDPSLISEFKTALLASQQYDNRQAVANQLEQTYLEGFFGNDPKIIAFAQELLLAGKREGAKELNRMVKVVGGGVSPDKIIEQLEAQYLPHRKVEREEKERVRKEKERIKEKQLAEEVWLGRRYDEQNKSEPVSLMNIVAVLVLGIFVFIVIAGL